MKTNIEHWGDICNNAATVSFLRPGQDLMVKLMELYSFIETKCGHAPNRVVCTKKTVHDLKQLPVGVEIIESTDIKPEYIVVGFHNVKPDDKFKHERYGRLFIDE